MSGISGLPEVKRVQITGSLRRKKSFIRDIDIIVLPDFNKEIYDFTKSRNLLKKISGLDFIKKIISIDKRIDSISAKYDTSFGIDLEIIVSSQSCWHYDLFNTTGSKSHVSAIKKLANKKNITLEKSLSTNGSNDKSSANSSLGLKYTILNNKAFTPDSSASKIFNEDFSDRPVYDLLGLEYIEPELRENKGELELAHTFKLPKLVRVQDIKGDLHIHSYWSDGLIDINELLGKLRAYNYSYFAITDHSASNQYGNGLSIERLFEKMAYVEIE